MTYEKKTGAIDLEKLEVEAEEVQEASASNYSLMQTLFCKDFYFLCW